LTVGIALERARERLRASDSARADASRLLEATLQRDAGWLLANDAALLEPDAARRFDAAVARRAAGEPVAYIVGHAGFYGRRFEVTSAVLVPRPETEELAERAIAFLRARGDVESAFLDVGTGSGALAITLACELPTARGTAIDVSPAALAVAERNAAALGVAARLTLIEADLLESTAVTQAAPFACIVANLPYVPTAELARPPDPTSFEPRLALDGGADGLELYRRLFARAPQLLAAGGALFAEAAPPTATVLAALAVQAFGPDALVRIHRDYGGRERIVEALRP
jgi:release factor glutamine methyltransferase